MIEGTIRAVRRALLGALLLRAAVAALVVIFPVCSEGLFLGTGPSSAR